MKYALFTVLLLWSTWSFAGNPVYIMVPNPNCAMGPCTTTLVEMAPTTQIQGVSIVDDTPPSGYTRVVSDGHGGWTSYYTPYYTYPYPMAVPSRSSLPYSGSQGGGYYWGRRRH